MTNSLKPLHPWSGSAMMRGKLQVLDVLHICFVVGQGPTRLALGENGGCLDIFLSYIFSLLSPYLSADIG